MRTTLTLDDDVAAKLKAEQSRAGLPFKEVVNETLRRTGLARSCRRPTRSDFLSFPTGAKRRSGIQAEAHALDQP